MASEFGFTVPTGAVLANPQSSNILIREFECETAAGCYPGRLVKNGSTLAEAVVNDTSDNSGCLGWIGYEQASLDDRPDTIDTVWTVNKSMPVISGPGAIIRAALCGGALNSVVRGEYLKPASYYGSLDFCPLPGVGTAPAHTPIPVAKALESLDKSAVARTSTSTIWVMSLI